MTCTELLNDLMRYYGYAYTSNLFFVLITGFCDCMIVVDFYKYKKLGHKSCIQGNKAVGCIIMFSNIICFLGILFSLVYSGILSDYNNTSYFYRSCIYLGIEIILIGANIIYYIVSPE